MRLRGQYTIWMPNKEKIVVPNALVVDGFISLLKMLWQGDTSLIAGGGNFWVGLKDSIASPADTLATLTGEPGAGDVNYTRKAVTRDSSGWPTVEVVNNNGHVRSLVVTFTALTSNWVTTVQRCFLCSISAGTGGKLFSESAPFPAGVLLAAGQSLPVQYDLWLD